VEVIGHDDEFVEQIFFLKSLVKESLNEGNGQSCRLKEALPLACGCSNEVNAVSGIALGGAAISTSAAEAASVSATLAQRLKRCATQKQFLTKPVPV
jgi:hypothetical protein